VCSLSSRWTFKRSSRESPATPQALGLVDKHPAEVSTPATRRAVDRFNADDNFRLTLELTHGSVNVYHAKLGGLLLHILEATSIARATAKTMNANVELVAAGALLHDVGWVEGIGSINA